MGGPQREVTLILGQTGSGKSWLAREIVRAHPRVLIADAGFGEFNVPTFRDSGELIDYLEDREAFGTRRPFHAALDPRLDEYHQVFDIAKALGNVLLVLEEADRFSDVTDDWGGAGDPSYREIIYRGRHYGVSLLLVSLSPRAIPTEVRRQATRIVSFRQIFPDDVRWLGEVVGSENADLLPSLGGPPQSPPHPRLEWTQVSGAKIISPKALDKPHT